MNIKLFVKFAESRLQKIIIIVYIVNHINKLQHTSVEQRSARQSVTLEIAGSIPVEAAIILTKEDFAYDCIC